MRTSCTSGLAGTFVRDRILSGRSVESSKRSRLSCSEAASMQSCSMAEELFRHSSNSCRADDKFCCSVDNVDVSTSNVGPLNAGFLLEQIGPRSLLTSAPMTCKLCRLRSREFERSTRFLSEKTLASTKGRKMEISFSNWNTQILIDFLELWNSGLHFVYYFVGTG